LVDENKMRDYASSFMKLLLPSVLAHLTQQARGQRDSVQAGMIAMMHEAEKFVFDSGMDRDESVTTAFRETALAMMEAGIFHLPYPMVWVEDPFPDDDPDQTRYMYLCIERDKKIFIWFYSDLFGSIVSLPEPLEINLEKPTDSFYYPTTNPHAPAFYKVASEAVYAVKKFIVTLGTRGTERATVKGGNHALNMKPRGRKYPFTVVRIPTDYSSPIEGDEKGHGGYRRMHLVRGSIWGKNTRPVEEQRWIESYWRGREDLGTVTHHHHQVRETV
jgi:hypothetical protein